MTLIMFFEFVIGLTDVFVAGRVGKDIQAAYGFVIQFYFIFIVVANALTVGTVSVISRLFTSKDKDQLTAAVFSSLSTTAGAGIVFAVVGVFFAPPLIRLLNIPAQVKPFTIPLIQIYSGGLFFHYLVINTNGILRSCDLIRVSLRTMTVVCCVNVALNFFFVFFTPLGFKGIALATATAVFVGSLINLSHVKRLMTGVRTFSRGFVMKIAVIGWPMGAVQILWQAGSMVLFLIISELPENRVEILAALTAGLRIESAIYLPAFAFNMANAVIVGNLLGEKKEEEAYKSGLVTALIGVSVVAFMALLVVVNAWWIAILSLHQFDRCPRECPVHLYLHDQRTLHGLGHHPWRRLKRGRRHQECHDPGGYEHLVHPVAFGLSFCGRLRLWSRLGLVVHEHFPVRPMCSPLPPVRQKTLALRLVPRPGVGGNQAGQCLPNTGPAGLSRISVCFSRET